jgi:hypothetical protein
MRWLYKLPLRLRSLFRQSHVEQDLSDELRFHLEKLIDEKIAKGMTPEEACYAALRELGGVEQIKEECRDMRRVNYLDDFLQDVRYGLRQLRLNSGFTAVAVVTLALGIGANTAVFSVLNAVLLRPLPYRSAEQLAMLWTERPSQNLREGRSAYWNVEQWRRQSKSFADMAVFDPVSVTLTTADKAERIGVVRISSNFFPLLGVQPLQGRIFSAREAEQQQRLALISHRFWQTRFGGLQDAIGARVEIDGVPRQIIGILPASFEFPQLNADVWEPDTMFPDWETRRSQRGSGSWFVVGRLRPDATFQEAQAEMNTIARRLDDQMPASERSLGISVAPLSLQVAGPRLRLALWMLTAAVFCVLLIAATNVNASCRVCSMA